jgi:hypothetical protein
MSVKTETDGSVVCLSLTYYLQPNSGATIKVIMENEYDEVIVVGTATAQHRDIQVTMFLLLIDNVAFELCLLYLCRCTIC